jgi:hypothetical protein
MTVRAGARTLQWPIGGLAAEHSVSRRRAATVDPVVPGVLNLKQRRRAAA